LFVRTDLVALVASEMHANEIQQTLVRYNASFKEETFDCFSWLGSIHQALLYIVCI